jgi:tetratricopeptide (TPR) repeat protein
MRRVLSFAVCLGAAVVCRGADDVDGLVAQGVAAEARLDPKAALVFFRQADKGRPDDPMILQKIAQELSDSTDLAKTQAEREKLVAEALPFAQRAMALSPKSAVNVLSVAICYGKLALDAGTRAKIEDSRLVKRYAEEALALDPNYAWAHHVLARWNVEVASLGFADRMVVRVVYGGLPEASFDVAIQHFRRAVELAPDQPSHRLELGFAYLAAGRKADARREFTAGLALSSREVFDDATKGRAREALAKLK